MTRMKKNNWIGLAVLALGPWAACNCQPEVAPGPDAGIDSGHVSTDAGGDSSTTPVDAAGTDTRRNDAAAIDHAGSDALGQDATATDAAGADATGTDAATGIDTAPATDAAVGNLPPVVNLLSPSNGQSFARGQTIVFNCNATDPETGAIANGSIVWTDGTNSLGIGARVQTALDVVGDHVISCTATDPAGLSRSASITITIVGNRAPQVSIERPADGSYFLPSDTITFNCLAVDPEDGLLTGTSIRWLDGADQIGMGVTLTTAMLLGDHSITCEATDSQGATGSAVSTIHVVTNVPPRCNIQQPNNNDTVVEGASVTFDVNCFDPDSATPIPNASILWSSSLDGQLGRGATVVNALVSVGQHTITVCAPDPVDANVQGCSSVTVDVVVNQPPVVNLVEPLNGASFEACQQIALSCRATDPEGTNIAYQWSSSLDGVIGNNRDIFGWQPQLPGTHVLTCSATDLGGLGKSASAQVTVAILSPRVRLNHPADGSAYAPGVSVAFAGNACDTVDGQLFGGSLVWTSSIDGRFGTGTTFNSNALSAGAHTITLTATNSATVSRSASITLYIDAPPQVTITAPRDGANVTNTAVVDFAGTATDAEDGNLTSSIGWRDSFSGLFGSGGATSSSNLALGKHVITASVVDSLGVTGSARVSILVGDGNPLFASRNFGQVNAIARDPNSGGYWLASSIGLRSVDPAGLTLGALYTAGNSDLPGNMVLDVLMLADNTLLVATSNGLAVCASPGAGQTGSPTNCNIYQGGDLALQSDTIRALLQLPDGRTLIGTSQCLMFSNWATNQHRDYCQGDGGGDGLIADRIQALAYDAASGVVFVGTDGGVSVLEPAAAPEVMDRGLSIFTNLTNADGLVNNDVRAIAVAPSGDVWFATAGGLSQLAAGGGLAFTSYTTANGLPSNAARDVAIDLVTIDALPHEVVWVATAGGLGRIDAAVPSVIAITTTDGLPSNNCFSIDVGAQHVKYVGTDQGIASYRGW